MTSKAEKAKSEAIESLRGLLKPGDLVYTKLEHVARSGMMRVISVLIIRDDRPIDISFEVGQVVGYKFNDRHGGLTVSGCGMDMGFSVVYNLSSAMFKDGFECIGENCPSNDHRNGDRNYEPHHHNSGGYALVHRWI